MSLEQQMQLSRQSSESTHTRNGEKKQKQKSFMETNERGACPVPAPHVRAPCGGMCFSVPKVTHLAFSRDLQEAPRTHVPVLSTSHKNNQPR